MSHLPPEKRKKIFAAVSIVLFLVLSLAVAWFVGRPMLQFASQPDRFRSWVDSHGIWGNLAFLGMMILQVVVAIIPGEPLEIGAGYTFGFWEGTLLCLLGIAIGGAIIFLLVRQFGMRVVELFFTQEKIQSLSFLHQSKKRDILLFLILFIPGTPKDLLSYFAGLTDIRFSKWLLLSTVARIPSVITSTVGGSAVGDQNYLFAVAVFAVTLLISALGLFFYNRFTARQEKRPPDDL